MCSFRFNFPAGYISVLILSVIEYGQTTTRSELHLNIFTFSIMGVGVTFGTISTYIFTSISHAQVSMSPSPKGHNTLYGTGSRDIPGSIARGERNRLLRLTVTTKHIVKMRLDI